MRVKNSRQISR